jgi:hypothetical protein
MAFIHISGSFQLGRHVSALRHSTHVGVKSTSVAGEFTLDSHHVGIMYEKERERESHGNPISHGSMHACLHLRLRFMRITPFGVLNLRSQQQ